MVVVGDAVAVLEAHAGKHVGDEFVAVEASPALLGGVEELVGHRERGLLRPGTLRDLGPELDGREAALDRVGGPEVAPVLGGEVVERQQLGLVIGDLLDGLGELRAVLPGERLDRGCRVLAVLGVVDVLDGLLGCELGRLWEAVEAVGCFVNPASLVPTGLSRAAAVFRRAGRASMREGTAGWPLSSSMAAHTAQPKLTTGGRDLR